MRSKHLTGFAAGLFVLSACICGANAQIAVSANDGRATLNDGANAVVDPPVPDSVTLIDLSAMPPKVIAEIAAPASVVGPPTSVAVSPDGSIALVSAATKLDPADPKKVVPDNRVSVIDLKATPPAVTATLESGPGAAGVAIHPSGNLALVANRNEGTVSVFTIVGGALTAGPKIALGDAKSGPSGISFTPDGKTALVTRDGDHKISVLTIDGGNVEASKRELSAGIRPYGVDISARGDVAAVANIGTGSGDADTVSLIDMKASPPRVVETFTVGQTPEGLKMSPDGQFVAVTVMNGSNKPKASPFFNDNGLVVILSVNDTKLAKVAEAKVGHWCQGAAWSKDGKTVIVQCMIERELQMFGFDGKDLKPVGAIKLKAGPAAIATAQR
ncbi:MULTISPECIES: YncE family protein [Rhodomicrobium]|uniref:YncE family protein n=1 Tax=Rhodomicrobium TaxID=1068 RepID=UPI000B4AF395|nr:MULTISPECIES: YncE family protein [Rhodomicrobium]